MAAGAVTVNISKPSGKGLYFDGNDYITAGNLGDYGIQAGEYATVAAWIWCADTSLVDEQAIIRSENQIRLHLKTTGKLEFAVMDDAWCTRIVESPAAIGSKGWHHVAGVFEKNKPIKLYLDGALINTGTGTITAIRNVNTDVAIGRYHDTVSDYLHGWLDNVRIFKRALTAAEILTLYTQENTGKGTTIDTTDMMGYWPFTDTTTPAQDESGNGNDGTVTGAVHSGGLHSAEQDIRSSRVDANSQWGFIPLANGRDVMTIHIEN